MMNIKNIIKYNFKEQKNLFIIEGSIILIFTILAFILPRWFALSVIMIPAVSTILTVNFIISIIRFTQGISGDEGRRLFLAPIKGWQYMFAKSLEYIIIQVLVIIMCYIGTIISGNSGSLVAVVGVSTGLGLTIAYIFIITFIPIVSSYFRKNFTRVFMTIVAFLIYGILTFVMEVLTYSFLPYVYMQIGNFIEINLISTLFNLVSFGAIIWLAVYHIDNKLDII